jgi:hypothetical protein
LFPEVHILLKIWPVLQDRLLRLELSHDGIAQGHYLRIKASRLVKGNFIQHIPNALPSRDMKWNLAVESPFLVWVMEQHVWLP